jgi:FMN phosphatase YigB (HAD superfamily)
LHSLGRVSKQEKYEQLSSLTGVSVFDLEKIGSLLLESHILKNETKLTLEYLHNKGYKLGIISNNISEDVEYILKREKIDGLFETVVCSSSVGERKPSAKIFLEAYKNISKQDYENILFVSDELAEDIIGSMALGTKNAWISKNTVNSWRKAEPEIFKTDYKIESVSELKNIL